MSRTGRRSGPTDVPRWVLRANEAFERIWLLVRINVVWTLLTLLGLVVLGIGPATCAAADALLAAREGRRVRALPLMWTSYRTSFWRTVVRMLPLQIVQGGSAAMLWLIITGSAGESMPLATVLAGLATVSGSWATISLAAIAVAPRVRRQDAMVTWRLALLLPGALPLRSIILILVLLVWGALCWLIPPLGLLVGAAAAIDVATGLHHERIVALLEQVDEQQPQERTGYPET